MKRIHGFIVVFCVCLLGITECATLTVEESAEKYRQKGTTQLDKKNYNRALEYIDKAIEIYPEFARAYHNRAMIYHTEGRYIDYALKDYKKALEIDPNFIRAASANAAIAQIYLYKDDLTNALTYISRAIAIDEKNEQEELYVNNVNKQIMDMQRLQEQRIANEQREQERRIANEQRERERPRLRDETDTKFGVVAIGSLLHVKNGEVRIGEVIRLGDTFSYNMDWPRSRSSGGYIFGDFNEFEIRGLDMRQVKVKEIKPDMSARWSHGGGYTLGGRRGYIVKYLGTEDVITQAGLRKIIWVLECIGGNPYVE